MKIGGESSATCRGCAAFSTRHLPKHRNLGRLRCFFGGENMPDYTDKVYDVVIVGGGPAGATLGARLKRETDLSVAIFEAEFFPRDHIGETFVHTIVPSIVESGAFRKVMDSDCYVKKGGGFYSWDPKQPWSTYFEHGLHERDGYFRWSIHV